MRTKEKAELVLSTSKTSFQILQWWLSFVFKAKSGEPDWEQRWEMPPYIYKTHTQRNKTQDNWCVFRHMWNMAQPWNKCLTSFEKTQHPPRCFYLVVSVNKSNVRFPCSIPFDVECCVCLLSIWNWALNLCGLNEEHSIQFQQGSSLGDNRAAQEGVGVPGAGGNGQATD